eukprot:CAMPEP_0119381154 /NCGR_PEP_ID=MMETSP1334-20130426/61479_1 /TAXON_ID=127549 /ORGANISM="Calcidiscus leptoporus, Strain RCC1130" /LENGTH=45 /DNA_ID= /DNA_START= /DNA_END= /DNA_ORIENTATION=
MPLRLALPLRLVLHSCEASADAEARVAYPTTFTTSVKRAQLSSGV